MSDTTKIQWADATFNPWIGCTKVSPGCLNCYAENTTRARVLRSQGHETWGKGNARSRTSAATWRNPVKWNNEAEARRLRELHSVGFGEVHNFIRPRVFPSLCDWLDDEVPIEWLADFLKLIYETPNLDWLLLTKRPENWNKRIEDALIVANGGNPKDPDYFAKHGDDFPKNKFANWLNEWTGGTAPKNIWLVVSVEDQKRADERIPELLKIPAKVRGLSCEPLLEYVGIAQFGFEQRQVNPRWPSKIDWVIVGGESGSKSRECNIDWIRSIVGQCKASGVACFVKQMGSKPCHGPDDGFPHVSGDVAIPATRSDGEGLFYATLKDKKGGDINEWPEDLRVREFPEVRP
jgi:protein gp37